MCQGGPPTYLALEIIKSWKIKLYKHCLFCLNSHLPNLKTKMKVKCEICKQVFYNKEKLLNHFNKYDAGLAKAGLKIKYMKVS